MLKTTPLKVGHTYQIVTTNALYERVTVLAIQTKLIDVRYAKSTLKLDRFDRFKCIENEGTKVETINRRYIVSYREMT